VSDLEASFPEESQERKLANLWFRLLPGAASADVYSQFDALGGDSICLVRLLVEVEKLTGRRIPLSDFMVDPTLPRLLHLASCSSSNKGQPLVGLHAKGDGPPVYCLYGMFGDIYHYMELARALGQHHPVFGIRSLALDDLRQLPESVEVAADRALCWIREAHRGVVPYLIGYSWGGVLAFEVARRWLQQEGTMPFVALLGTDAPRRLCNGLQRTAHFVRWLPSWAHLKARDGLRHPPTRMVRRLVGYFAKDPASQRTRISNQQWSASPIVRHLIAIEDRYQPRRETALDVHLFREGDPRTLTPPHPLDSASTGFLQDAGWRHWTTGLVDVHWINASHDDLLRAPIVQGLAERLQTLMEQHAATYTVSC
jgi:thioesterase domain-containing protein